VALAPVAIELHTDPVPAAGLMASSVSDDPFHDTVIDPPADE
jgi:hypothetical protein